MSLPDTLNFLHSLFSASAIARGKAYAASGAVLRCSVDSETEATALVQGSRRTPYEVSLMFDEEGLIETECTCPMEFDCKHAVAAAIVLSKTYPSAAAMLNTANNSPAAPSLPLQDERSLPTPLQEWSKKAEKLAQARNAPAETSLLSLSFEENTNETTKKPGEQILYIFNTLSRESEHFLLIEIKAARMLSSGTYGAPQDWSFERLRKSTSQTVTAEDVAIGDLFASGSGGLGWYNGSPPRDPEIFDFVLKRMIGTGRAFLKDKSNPPLKLGPERHFDLRWNLRLDGTQKIGFMAGEEVIVLSTSSPWYIDTTSWEAGPAKSSTPEIYRKLLLEAPPVEPQHAQSIVEALTALNAEVVLPLPRTDISERLELAPVLPVLRLGLDRASLAEQEILSSQRKKRYSYADTQMPRAFLHFDYSNTGLSEHVRERRMIRGNELVVQKRDLAGENKALAQLLETGLAQTKNSAVYQPFGSVEFAPPTSFRFTFEIGQAGQWVRFVKEALPELAQLGFKITVDDSFPYRLVHPDNSQWQIQLSEESGSWFSAALDIDVHGRKIALLPVILSALRACPQGVSSTTLGQLNVDGQFLAKLANGELLVLEFERVKTILQIIVELFDLEKIPKSGAVRLTLLEAWQLSGFSDAKILWRGSERIRRLFYKGEAFSGIKTLEPPASFKSTLRNYQKDGLGWLQFIREFGLGGILADDMGLGKTVQTLAHLCLEKENQRLEKPALVVCPTSVLPNWLKEAQKFAPSLKVMSLHGWDSQSRSERLKEVHAVDLAVTTYSLMHRDAASLSLVDWSVVILDEAQAIKNPLTITASVACSLKAEHRLCLTGTPVENHLGELWSQFNFLMPGVLGSHESFKKNFRIPIEDQNDIEKKQILASRLRPVLLRRAKTEVARELPAKTVINKSLTLAGDQRDLYETVRLVMHDKVRKEVESKGFKRSQIIILDALLKLRQVCCDPRLLTLPAAQGVKTSGKLDLLKEMVSELVDEGRKVLVFSQFTSMLDLIKPELTGLQIPFVEIRGDTKDRSRPVEVFQAGDCPVFLLSLKAGGTGLNLTAADTVIHYDPWWNPAVENQATDRAHRIGQDKAVFVFKLIALGTIEEKMLALQERKKAIANSVYEHGKEDSGIFSEADLEQLFARWTIDYKRNLVRAVKGNSHRQAVDLRARHNFGLFVVGENDTSPFDLESSIVGEFTNFDSVIVARYVRDGFVVSIGSLSTLGAQ